MMTSVHVSIGVGELYRTSVDVRTTNRETFHVSFNTDNSEGMKVGSVTLYGSCDDLRTLLEQALTNLETA